jgi:hypothetical protein
MKHSISNILSLLFLLSVFAASLVEAIGKGKGGEENEVIVVSRSGRIWRAAGICSFNSAQDSM